MTQAQDKKDAKADSSEAKASTAQAKAVAEGDDAVARATQARDEAVAKAHEAEAKAKADAAEARAKRPLTRADLVVIKRELETFVEERESSYPTTHSIMHLPGGGMRQADWRQQDHAKVTGELAAPLLERAVTACDTVASGVQARGLLPEADSLPTTTAGWLDIIIAVLNIVKGILGGTVGTTTTAASR